VDCSGETTETLPSPKPEPSPDAQRKTQSGANRFPDQRYEMAVPVKEAAQCNQMLDAIQQHFHTPDTSATLRQAVQYTYERITNAKD
jgi:hypothetical protein